MLVLMIKGDVMRTAMKLSRAGQVWSKAERMKLLSHGRQFP